MLTFKDEPMRPTAKGRIVGAPNAAPLRHPFPLSRLACAAGLAVSLSAIASAQVVASWVNPGSGVWSAGLNWSSAPAAPGAPGSAGDVATIDLVTGAPYTVTLNSPVSLASLTLNSADATLLHSAGTLDIDGDFDLRAGLFRMATGSTLRRARVVGNGGAFFIFGESTLDGVSLDADVTVAGAARVRDGLTIGAGRAIHLAGPDSQLLFTANSTLESQTLGGGGEVVFDGPNAFISSFLGLATIGHDAVVRTGLSSGLLTGLGAGVANQGTIRSAAAGRAITLSSGFYNDFGGRLEASSGGSLLFRGGALNRGSVALSGGTLDLGGGSTISAGAAFNTAGGTVNVTGSVVNSDTLNLNAATGSWNLRGGFLQGGALLTTAGAALFVPTGSTGTIDGVNVMGEVSVRPGATLNLLGNWQSGGLFRLDGGTMNLGGTFRVLPSQSWIRTGGTVNFTGVLDNAGSVFALDASAGVWRINGGVIRGGTLAPNGLTNLDVVSGWLDGVTLGGDLSVGGSSSIGLRNNINLNGHSIFLLGQGAAFDNNGSATGPGEIVFNNPGGASSGALTGGTSFTIGEGTTVRTGVDGGTVGQATRTLENRGRILAMTPNRTLTVRGSNWTNAATGVLEVANGGRLVVTDAWTNAGEIRVGDGVLELGGNNVSNVITWLPSARIVRTGSGTVQMTAIMELGGGTLTLSDVTGALTLVGGEIRHGTVVGSGAGRLLAAGAAFPRGLVDVTLAANLDIGTAGVSGVRSVYVTGGLELVDRTVTLLSASGSTALLSFQGSQSFSGSGQALFDVTGNGTASGEIGCTRANGLLGALTIGPGITIATNTGGGRISATDGVTNHGLVSARAPGKGLTATGFANAPDGVLETLTGASLKLDGAWSNAGLIRVNGGALELSGTFSQLGSVERTGGVVTLSGIYDNAGKTLALDGPLGPWILGSSGKILGGVVRGGATGLTLAPNALAVLSSVTLKDTLLEAFTGQVLVVQGSGVTLDDSTIQLWNSNLQFESAPGAEPMHISGGEIVVRSGTNSISAGRVVLDAGSSLRSGPGSAVLNLTASAWRNRGVISAAAPGAIFNLSGVINDAGALLEAKDGGTLNLQFWGNAGTISLGSGGTLNLGGTFSAATMGTVVRTGGTVNLTGTFHNAGSVFDLNAATGSWNLQGGTIKGGEIRASEGSALSVTAQQSGTIIGTLLGANVTVASGATLGTSNTDLLLDGAVIKLVGGALDARLTIGGAGVFGSGEIVFEGATGKNRLTTGSSSLTIDQGITVRTSAGGGFVGATNTGLTNRGLIDAALTGAIVEVAGSNWTNAVTGEIRARSGAQATLKGAFTNAGRLLADGGTVRVEGAAVQPTSGRIEARNGAVNFLSPASFVNNGQILADTGGTVHFGGSLTLGSVGDATVVLGGSEPSESGKLTITLNAFVAPDSLAVVLGPSFSPRWGDLFTILEYASLSGASVLTDLPLPSLEDPANYRWWRMVGPSQFTIGVRHVADTNRDAAVDFLDLNNVLSAFGQTGAGLVGDADENGLVDFVDLNLVLGAFGQYAPEVIPSPSTLTLLAGVAFGATLRRRR